MMGLSRFSSRVPIATGIAARGGAPVVEEAPADQYESALPRSPQPPSPEPHIPTEPAGAFRQDLAVHGDAVQWELLPRLANAGR